ncbi:MAG: Fe-S cluster assembly protein SufD, partial [Gemmatimonadaceae bacterium]
MIQTYLREFESFAANGGGAGPGWLLPVRRSAMSRFSALGFPTPKNEDWHFTSIAPIAEREFRLIRPSAAVNATDLARFTFGHPDWHTVVFVNGRYNEALSNISTLPRGLRVMELSRAWREESELLERYLTKVASYDDRSFTALNTAFMTDGAVVHAEKGVEVERPVHLVHIATPAAADAVWHPRHLVVAEPNSKVTVIESWVALGDNTYFTNAVTEAVVGDGATVTHYKIQRESPSAFHVGTVETTQGRDSHLVSFSFATGASLSRTNIYTLLDGEGCGATLHGLYMVDGEQHVDHQTRIEHAQPNCFSREVYKGILDGSSHGVFNGKVYVRPEAQKTDGKQSNNNLLLSDRARVDTKPQLEIFADDVKCTHGATVGRLDELARFYMRSRGLGAASARKLLTYAFAAEVLEEITVDAVREELERLTLARYTG